MPRSGCRPPWSRIWLPAEGDRLLDLLRELLLREDVALLRGQVAVEGAERAVRGADVRVVDVAVDDVGHDRLGVLPPAHRVGQRAELEEVAVAQERDPLLARRAARRPAPSGRCRHSFRMEPQLRDGRDQGQGVGAPVELAQPRLLVLARAGRRCSRAGTTRTSPRAPRRPPRSGAAISGSAPRPAARAACRRRTPAALTAPRAAPPRTRTRRAARSAASTPPRGRGGPPRPRGRARGRR